MQQIELSARKPIVGTDDSVTVASAPTTEEELFNLAVGLLQRSHALESNAVCLQLIERLAEHVGYQRAKQDNAGNVTELMLMASRAADLAKKL